MAANVKAKADQLPYAYEILDDIPGVDLQSITYAFNNLSSTQKDIVYYLFGCYNHMYLSARGFRYNINVNETTLKAQFIALGQKALQFAFSVDSWRSRVNEVFRQYMSSCIVYASGISSNFDTWYNSLKVDGQNTLFIPYSKEAFDAWTTFYNDPTGDGIAHFGEEISAWESGIYYDFNFVGIPWASSRDEGRYNDYILNHSPVLYTAPFPNNNIADSGQRVLGLDESYLMDSLFIQRGSFQYCRYGYSNMTLPANQSLTGVFAYVQGGKINCYNTSLGVRQVINLGSEQVLSEAIRKCFLYSPFTFVQSQGDELNLSNGWYPFIEHVFLVDNIDTLANPEEIFNTESLNVVAPQRPEYIISPNGRWIYPVRPFDDDPLGIWDLIDNSYDPETDEPASNDDFGTQIVNNTTINNYYISDDTKINVPVEWFENPYTIQLYDDSESFFGFVKDCTDTLGDLQLYIYGAIVVGLAGGVLKKLLL